MKNNISINTLISNAENGITSRHAYIQKIIQEIMNTPLRDFCDRNLRGICQTNNGMESVLRELELPEECMDNKLKDLIYLILAYKDSEDGRLQICAKNAIIQLANLVVNNNKYKYL